MNNFLLPLDEIKARLSVNIPPLMQKFKVPGLSLVMFKGQEIVMNYELGVKNINTSEAINASTVFEGASFSKPIAAYCALQMCQQGILELDRPLKNYLKRPYRHDPEHISLVTLRQILFHISGFPEFHDDFIVSNELESYPGSKFQYSGPAFDYLGYVMAAISKERIAPYLKKSVLDPLGMKDSNYDWEQRYEQQAASGHDKKGRPIRKWRPKRPFASGSLHTTPTDFAKFMIEVLKQSRIPPADNMLNMLDTRLPIDNKIDLALSWGIESTDEGEVFFHACNSKKSKGLGMAYREQEFGVVFMANSINAYHIFPDVIKHSIGGDHQAIIDFEEFEK